MFIFAYAKCWISHNAAYLHIVVAVYAVPENEDEALRKVFEYLKRKYSDDLSDVADTDSLPTLNPITPSLTPPPALNPITPSLTPPPVIRHATHDDLAPKNLAEPAEREEMTIDAKQITVHEKTRQSGNSRNEFHKPHALPGCDFLLNILHEAPFLPIKNDVIGEYMYTCICCSKKQFTNNRANNALLIILPCG